MMLRRSTLLALSILLVASPLKAAADQEPLSCYYDTDLVTGGDDGKALCGATNLTTTGGPCYKGEAHCVSLLYGGIKSGLGCVSLADNEENPVSCNIMMSVDPRITGCEYCEGDLCNVCSDGEQERLSCYYDTDLVAGGDDFKALCDETDLTTTGGPCYKGEAHCVSLLYDDTKTGLGCVSLGDNDENPVSCNIMMGVDPRITGCEYCEEDLCNVCSDDPGSDASYSSGRISRFVVFVCLGLITTSVLG